MDARRAALARALEAYEGGDFFEAHELLEPAWMGTADEGERELYQGLIKLAAAGVHLVRGNPQGMANNLRGARLRLSRALQASERGEADETGPAADLDLPRLLSSIDELLARVEALPPPPPRPAGASRFTPRPRMVGVEMPALHRRVARR